MTTSHHALRPLRRPTRPLLLSSERRPWPVPVMLALALLPGLWPVGAWASDRQDHEQAREALARGQVMPLKSVLDQLARQRPGGHILEVELERTNGRWIYEIKQMDASGQLVKLKLDAQTGLLLTPFKDTP